MNYRVLIIDDDPAIHEDFIKVLNPKNALRDETIKELNTKLFSNSSRRSVFPNYLIDSAFHSDEAIELVKNSITQGEHYALMFVDIKMGDGMDGVKIIQELRKLDHNIETVVCSAYSEYTLEEIVSKISKPDKLLFFKKPFTPIEIKQLANCLCLKWSAQKKDTGYIENLEVLAHSKTQNLKILIDSAITINQTLETRDAFHSVLERICSNSSFCGGHVYLVNDKGQLYSSDIWYMSNITKTEDLIQVTNKIKSVYAGEDLPGHILVEKETIVIQNLDKISIFKRSKEALKADIKTIVGIPVLLGKRVMGAVELYSQVESKIDQNLLEVLSETVNLLSRSIERSLTEEELRQSRKLALSADKAKSEFLANMSHEIRTPLNAILGYTQILLKNNELPELTKENYLNIVEKSGNHLLGIINTILDLSKIESGKSSLKIKPLNLKALLNEIKSMFAVKCEQKKIALQLDISDTIPHFLNGDNNKLKHILINLAGNAVKHTTAGAIIITCLWNKNTAFFEVTDTGCGVAKEHIADIFTPFFQVELLEEREGTGLGLAIVKKEVELMKGSISVASTLGKGTTFKFQIPMTKAIELKDSSSSIPVIHELEKDQNWCILLIDNDKVSKELLYDIFTLHHFKVFKSNYDPSAIQIAFEQKPHAIFFNLNYPILGNSAILLRIKEAFPDIILIGISSEMNEKVIEGATKLGCNEIIYKPFDINNVLHRLSKHLPIKYKYHESKAQEEFPSQNLVLDWEEIGRMMKMEDLNTLWDHFSNGDLSAIELTAQNIREKNIGLKDLCRQMIIWAKEFNDSELGFCLEKIEQIMENKNA